MGWAGKVLAVHAWGPEPVSNSGARDAYSHNPSALGVEAGRPAAHWTSWSTQISKLQVHWETLPASKTERGTWLRSTCNDLYPHAHTSSPPPVHTLVHTHKGICECTHKEAIKNNVIHSLCVCLVWAQETTTGDAKAGYLVNDLPWAICMKKGGSDSPNPCSYYY